jgi:hypothetical protein
MPGTYRKTWVDSVTILYITLQKTIFFFTVAVGEYTSLSLTHTHTNFQFFSCVVNLVHKGGCGIAERIVLGLGIPACKELYYFETTG